MSEALFRSEVVQARRTAWLGEVVLDTPPPLKLAVLLLCVSLALALAFVATADYGRRTRVAGQLVPDRGLVTVLAPGPGVVEGVTVEEGGAVGAGDVLVRLASAGASDLAPDLLAAALADVDAREHAAAAAHAAQRELAQRRAESAAAQHDRLDEERERLVAEALARETQHELARQSLARMELLAARQFVSPLQLAQQAAEVSALEATLRNLERQQAALRRQAVPLVQAADELPDELARLEALHARERAAFDQERRELHARHAARVPAPVPGMVAHRYVEAGAHVRAGEPLLALVPDGSRLEAHLAVPGSAVGLVRVGDLVRLRLAAFPYQAFGHQAGVVVRIGRSAVVREGGAEPVYRVVVAMARQSVPVDGSEVALSPGLVVDAEIFGERRSLLHWLLSPWQTIEARVRREEP